MGIVASKGDNNTPLLSLCKERKELIKAARDARYHLARSHLLYFKSLLDFTKALNHFVHKDLVVIPYSDDDDDSSSSDLVCSGSCSDTESDSDSVFVCDQSQPVSVSNSNDDQNQGQNVFGDGTCCSSNNGQEGMEKSNEGLGSEGEKLVSDPAEDEKEGLQNVSSVEQNPYLDHDIFGLYGPKVQDWDFIQPVRRDDEVESDGFREIREREGIPDLEPDSDHDSLIRKNQKKNKKKKKNAKESSYVACGIDKIDVDEVTTCNGQASGEVDDSNETCAGETVNTPENVTERVASLDEEVCDEAYESTSSSFTESSCSGLTDLRNVVEKINGICEKAVSNTEVSELLEVSKVVHHQPLGSQVKGFASKVLGSSGNSNRDLLLRRRFRLDDLAVSLSMTLEKLYMWEKKLHAEVTVEEKLRVSYDKAYMILQNLDNNGAESSELYKAETVVKFHLSKINVSVRAVESISMRIHKIRDEELSCQVTEIINGFKKMWRFLAKCHHKQFQVMARSNSCVHIVEKGSSSRKATQKVEEQIGKYRESLKGYIDAQRGFVKLLNEWLNRNIMEDDETETEAEAPEIFKICSEWLREIENVDEVKVLSAVEEMILRFRGLGFKQVEEEKQRTRTERLSKELERQTKELEEILGRAVVFPANDSGLAANMTLGPELLSLRESVTQETEKHERMIRELNDAVSMSLLECLVPIFEALEEFCFANYKAYKNIRIVPTETLLLLLCQT
ncbi:hypothetical protein CARUB_v10011692mg [Capsella rubella]|uniref:DUF632 domain-containing protein n=1 Tax=Capsella rubella TaxID=81985 RepID=R0GKU5_9BRAS|nr:uncharacterized protein LOC17897169 [Capsella rubella]EOA36552.1 hypothetical protein CARUB_v10011692mg [Capsella rubella]